MTRRVWTCPACQAELACREDAHACPACGWVRNRQGRLWLVHRDLCPAGFDRAAAGRLQAMEGHFWTRGRRRLVDRLLCRFEGSAGQAVELGCGTGGMLPILERRFAEVTAIDAYASLLEKAESNSARAALFQADVTRTTLPGDMSDFVMALDVIEHVDPDALLTEAHRISVPGGWLLLSAPAAPSLWSRMDESAGHRCRYTRASLTEELIRNGWIPLGFTHYQCLLFPLVWLSHVLGKRGDHGFERHPKAWLDRLLGGINYLEIAFFGMLSLPFGSSLFMWAKAGRRNSA